MMMMMMMTIIIIVHLEVNFNFVRSSSLVEATRLGKVGSYELT